jgi:nucleotide-binding universal stress UspA family protein
MLRFERIFCPVDLTTDDDSALRYAISLVGTYNSKLYICHCTDSFVDVAERDRLQLKFEALIRTHTAKNQAIPTNCEGLVIEGPAATMIPRAAAERSVDLIVMRSRRRPLAAALLGSTAESVCRTAPCPVLVMHPDEQNLFSEQPAPHRLRRILIGQDFSNDSELALKAAVSLAQEYQAELHLVHVLPVSMVPAMVALPPSLESDFQRAARMLQQSVPGEVHLWCRVLHAVKAGQPYREILTYAQEHEIDLICLGVHGAGFTMHSLFGSNADRVLRQAHCPVLIARPLKPEPKPLHRD